MKWDKSKLRAGMSALSPEGEKLGKVLRFGDKAVFIDGKGGKEIELPLDAIIEIRNDQLICSLSEEDQEEFRVQLLAEEADVEKVTKEAGHVRIKKEVKTEEKSFTVPVRKEEIVVERLPARQASSQTPGEDAFQERTIELTVHEEEVRVGKHPVVKEELRVRKMAHTESQEAATTLRHDEAEIEDSTHPVSHHKPAAATAQPAAKHAAPPARPEPGAKRT